MRLFWKVIFVGLIYKENCFVWSWYWNELGLFLLYFLVWFLFGVLIFNNLVFWVKCLGMCDGNLCFVIKCFCNDDEGELLVFLNIFLFICEVFLFFIIMLGFFILLDGFDLFGLFLIFFFFFDIFVVWVVIWFLMFVLEIFVFCLVLGVVFLIFIWGLILFFLGKELCDMVLFLIWSIDCCFIVLFLLVFNVMGGKINVFVFGFCFLI